MRHVARGVTLVLCLAAVAACSAIPRDTHGALSRARGGVLRVGIIEHRPWTVVDAGRIGGVEADLIERWAGQLGARVEWYPGDIEQLVEALHRRDIDVLAAGLDQQTPYAPKLALTQPYFEFDNDYGKRHRLVLAVTPGESALLFDLDTFLAALDRAALRAAADAARLP
jgi:ABC-type amino acid transport substrate-binding protein